MTALAEIKARLEVCSDPKCAECASINRLIRALEYATSRAHHYAQLCENAARDNRRVLGLHADKANEITDAEIARILSGEGDE